MSKFLVIFAGLMAISPAVNAQVVTQDSIQGQLVEMLQSGQAPAPVSRSPEPTGESTDAAAASEALEAPPVDAEAPATLSASQTYFQTLLGEVLQPFGLAEFENPGGNELLLFNALSDEYKLSVGDALQIVIRGLYSESMNVTIDRNGAVTLTQFLPISLAGLTVDEAAKHLAEVVQVNDASARVSVTVTSARLVPLQVGGMVSAPQVLAIPAYTPLSIALARSGGLQPDASLRRIRILSQEHPAREIDLYGLLLGDPDFREPLLAEGDRVFVPPSGGSIALAGVVPRYGIFELPQGQESISVSEALKLSGLSLVPQGLPLERVFFAQDGLPVSVVVTDPGSTPIKSGEALRVGMVKATTQGNVSVLGAAIEPFSQAFVEGLKLSSVLKGGAVLAPDADGDFVVLLTPRGSGPEPFRLVSIKAIQSGMDDPVLVPGSQILVPSVGQIDAILRFVSGEGDDDLSALDKSIANNIVVAGPSQIFVDGRLVAIVPPGVQAGLIDRYAVAIARADIYSNYALIEGADGDIKSLGLSMSGSNSLANFIPERATKTHLFSRQFLSETLRTKVHEEVVNLASEDVVETVALSDKLFRRLVSDTRLVSGEVSEPGAYPVSGGMTLASMISAAGGILPSGDASAVILRQYQVDGSVLSLAAERTIDTTRVDPSTVALDGIFGVLVQPLINDALVGEVTVGGEVRRPGKYSIERGDTIADLLARAGGLTNTAYPLGAVLSRSSLVESERTSNFELAKQLRESVLLNSQSEDSKDEEITAVLAFAQELEGSSPTGRQVVNIADGQEATFVLLEDGDRLVVPKRPSHVRVIGAVYSELAALYREGASPIDYVDDAGGLTRFADPRRSFMILPNGRSIPVNLRRNGSSVLVPPGSVIVVPPKLDRVSTMEITETISRALGSIASSVLALDVLSGP